MTYFDHYAGSPSLWQPKDKDVLEFVPAVPVVTDGIEVVEIDV